MNWQHLKQFDRELEQPTGARFEDGETLPIFDIARLDGPAPAPREWVLAGFIPEGEITLFTGPGGAGKSLIAQQLATCVAAQIPFLGVDTGKLEEWGNAVLYVTAEDDDDELDRRQRNIENAVGSHRLKDRLFLSSIRGRQGNELATFDREGLLEKGDTFKMLARTIIETGAQFVILDNVAHLFAGNENDRGNVTRFVNLLYSLVKTYGVTILLIGHPNKKGDDYSGSTAWLNAVRSQIHIDRVYDNHGNCLDPNARKLTLAKANYSQLGQRLDFRWHDFAFVREEDLPADTARELAQAAKANGENDAFLACLRERMKQGEGRAVGPSPGPNYAPSQFDGMREAKGFGRAALKRAMDRLFAIGRIESYTYRNASKGRDVTIIREVADDTPNPSRTPFPNNPEQSARTTPHTHSIPKGMSGAAPLEPPAPVNDGKDTCRACDGAGCDWCRI